MTRKSFCHLLEMLAEIPDPRNNKGKRGCVKFLSISESRIMRILGNLVSNQWQMRA